MLLTVGTRLGSYDIVDLLGAGGMGEVYRARDTRLGRDVAIKILPPAFTNDPDRLSRFAREARVLASLNHPNIATIHGFEEVRLKPDATSAGPGESGHHLHAIVLELVEGETLADRIARGPMPAGEVIAMARQIADALDAAHERGIVHRDLKPANIKVTPDDRVKVLDFGLAKLVEAGVGGAASEAGEAATATRQDVVLGTVPYMSPEQARGQDVDKRTDIWAFGCVLYEMLTGWSPFAGVTATDTLAAIVERNPDWHALPAATPAALRRLLSRCLEKDPRRRLRDIADARLDLEDAGDAAVHAPLLRYRTRAALPWTVAATLAVVLVGTVFVLRTAREVPATPAVSHLSIELGAEFLNATLPLAISPDGAYVAYQTAPGGQSALYIRALSEPEPRLVAMPGQDPFFSPDSQWLAFVADGKLKKMPVRGGPATALADAPGARGGTWNEDGVIVFAPLSRGPLVRVPADGGAVEPFTALDETKGETSHRQPVWLPDGRSVVYRAERADGAALMALRPGMPPRELVPDAAKPLVLPGHRLAFLHSGRLLVQQLDVDSLHMIGTPDPVLAGVAAFAVSASGTLVYAGQDVRRSHLAWVDREGRDEPLAVERTNFEYPRLSPDDRRVLLSIEPERNIWIYDIASASLARLTSEGDSMWGAWADDGRRVIYSANRPGTLWDLLSRPAEGGAEQPVVQRPLTQLMPSVARTGAIAYVETAGTTGNDIWLKMPGSAMPTPLVATPAAEASAELSADGRWLAYTSNESGAIEVYVRETTGGPARWAISTGGGVEPVWSASGRELFYRNGSGMWAVEIVPGVTLTIGRRQKLFDGPFELAAQRFANYDVTADGKRFLMIKPDADSGRVTSLHVVQHWLADLDRRTR